MVIRMACKKVIHRKLLIPLNIMADGVGFEPTDRLHDRRISSPVHSTALPPIRFRMQFGVWLRRALSPCDQVGQCRANRSPILSDIVSKDQNATRSRGRLHRGSVPSRHASEASDLGRSAAETGGGVARTRLPGSSPRLYGFAARRTTTGSREPCFQRRRLESPQAGAILASASARVPIGEPPRQQPRTGK